MFFKSRNHSNYFSLLDIGSSKVCCMIIKNATEGEYELVGLGYTVSAGIEGGNITDLSKATISIEKAVAQAEQQAQRSVGAVTVNISSSQLKSQHLQSSIELSDDKPISMVEIKKLIDSMLNTCAQEGYEILHAIPLSYYVDEDKTTEPVGLFGKKLSTLLHLISIPDSHFKNILTVLDRCHIAVENKVATPYATALSVVTEEEKDLGVSVIDFGAGCTEISMFLQGGLIQIGHIPMGGNSITRDIAQGLSCPVSVAERLKTIHGSAISLLKDEMEKITVHREGGAEDNSVQIQKSDFIRIITPRVMEILNNIKQILLENKAFSVASWKIVLTGGGSNLDGLKDKIAKELNGTVRIGRPFLLNKIPEQFDPRAFSTCLGLLKYVILKTENDKLNFSQPQKKLNTKKGIWQWLKQTF